MSIKTKKHYIFLLIVFFCSFNIVSANVFINEVKLSPTEERFIELYNSSDSSIDLTDWYIQRKTASGSTFGSLVSKTYFKGISIDPSQYLVISKTSIPESDILVEGLTLTEGNTIQLKNTNKEIVDSLEWGSINDRESFQIIDGNWVTGSPTPGKSNKINNNLDENENLSTGNNIDNSNILTSSNQQDWTPRKITSKIITPKVIFTGMPFLINSSITTNKKETLTVGKFKWNFGDGTIKENINSNEFEHTYFYPGEYVISFDYSERGSYKLDSTDRIVVRVVPSEILISSVGGNEDPFVEIENKSNYEMILSNWIISAGIHRFIIPSGTVILAKKKLKFSPRITGFTIEDLKFITITDPNGGIMAVYPIQKNQTLKTPTKTNSTNSITKITPKENNQDEVSSIIDLNQLEASVGKANKNISNSVYSYFGLGGVIVIGIASVLLLRKKDDYLDYMGKEIRAEDMTIIE